jgi:hypothetical protein
LRIRRPSRSAADNTSAQVSRLAGIIHETAEDAEDAEEITKNRKQARKRAVQAMLLDFLSQVLTASAFLCVLCALGGE